MTRVRVCSFLPDQSLRGNKKGSYGSCVLPGCEHLLIFMGVQPYAYEINDDHCYGDLKYSWNGYKGTAENISHHKKEVLIN